MKTKGLESTKCIGVPNHGRHYWVKTSFLETSFVVARAVLNAKVAFMFHGSISTAEFPAAVTPAEARVSIASS